VHRAGPEVLGYFAIKRTASRSKKFLLKDTEGRKRLSITANLDANGSLQPRLVFFDEIFIGADSQRVICESAAIIISTRLLCMFDAYSMLKPVNQL